MVILWTTGQMSKTVPSRLKYWVDQKVCSKAIPYHITEQNFWPIQYHQKVPFQKQEGKLLSVSPLTSYLLSVPQFHP